MDRILSCNNTAHWDRAQRTSGAGIRHHGSRNNSRRAHNSHHRFANLGKVIDLIRVIGRFDVDMKRYIVRLLQRDRWGRRRGLHPVQLGLDLILAIACGKPRLSNFQKATELLARNMAPSFERFTRDFRRCHFFLFIR